MVNVKTSMHTLQEDVGTLPEITFWITYWSVLTMLTFFLWLSLRIFFLALSLSCCWHCKTMRTFGFMFLIHGSLMTMSPLETYAWILGTQLVELFGKDQEVLSCCRMYVLGSLQAFCHPQDILCLLLKVRALSCACCQACAQPSCTLTFWNHKPDKAFLYNCLGHSVLLQKQKSNT